MEYFDTQGEYFDTMFFFLSLAVHMIQVRRRQETKAEHLDCKCCLDTVFSSFLSFVLFQYDFSSL